MAEHGAHHDLARAEPHDEVLVGDEVGQRQGGDPGLQLRSDAVAEQVDVVGADPAADVAVGDDDRASVAQRLVAAGVVEVVMGVDDVADRRGVNRRISPTSALAASSVKKASTTSTPSSPMTKPALEPALWSGPSIAA